MTVHFIGAGPGAPDLITLRGRDLIARCPLVLYAGSLVPREVLACAGPPNPTPRTTIPRTSNREAKGSVTRSCMDRSPWSFQGLEDSAGVPPQNPS